MLIEVVVAVVVLSAVLGVASRIVSARRSIATRSVAARGERGSAGTAAGPLDAGFPVERTPHERHVGDAAFVDGFVIGRYIAPHRPEEDPEAGESDRPDPVADGDDGSVTAASEAIDEPPASRVAGGVVPAPLEDPADPDLDLDLDAGYGSDGLSSWDGSEDETADDASEDAFDDGFGFEDGFEDDG